MALPKKKERENERWMRVCRCMLSHLDHVRLCAPMDCSPPASSVRGILHQEYWSGLPCPPAVDIPNPGIKVTSLMSPALAVGFFTTSATWEARGSAYSPPFSSSSKCLPGAYHAWSKREGGHWSCSRAGDGGGPCPQGAHGLMHL